MMRLASRLVASFVASLAASLVISGAFAQGYPSRPVRIVVGYPPGGPVDVTARILAPALQKSLGQPIVIDNRAGLSGTLGADAVVKAAPDGYTLLFTTSATRTMNPHVQKAMPFDALRDFTPIALVLDSPNVLVVARDSPYKTLADLVAYARANPNAVTFGSAGIGASNHLAGEQLAKLVGATMVHVPYKGNAPSLTDVIGGKITFMFDAVSTARAAVMGDRARALGIASATRHRALPDVPTMTEAGVKDFAGGSFYSVEGPRGLPAPIVERVNAAVRAALVEPEVARRLVEAGYDLKGGSPEELDARVRTEYERWKTVASGLKLD